LHRGSALRICGHQRRAGWFVVFESDHLDGDVDMIAVLKALLTETTSVRAIEYAG
jgi:D-mannonate dehydratase